MQYASSGARTARASSAAHSMVPACHGLRGEAAFVPAPLGDAANASVRVMRGLPLLCHAFPDVSRATSGAVHDPASVGGPVTHVRPPVLVACVEQSLLVRDVMNTNEPPTRDVAVAW